MDLFEQATLWHFGLYTIAMLLILSMAIGMYRLIKWSKKMPKGAFVFLAIFPVLSLFPIPPQEISKLERIRHEQIKEEDESGDRKETKDSET